MYDSYKKSRDAVWEIIIKYQIKSLPIQIYELCENMDIRIFSYRKGAELIKILKLEDHMLNNDGFAVKVKNRHIIFYDNNIKPYGRLRFTAAHEIGHIVLGHLEHDNISCRNHTTLWNNGEQKPKNINETQANIFASRLLAPACVLHELHITTIDELMNLTGLSRTAAEYRLQRLKELEKRNKFYISPLEQEVKEQFSEFIKNYNK